MTVIQSIKEDVLDVINDMKRDFWQLNQDQLNECDNIIKKMVFGARERDHIGSIY